MIGSKGISPPRLCYGLDFIGCDELMLSLRSGARALRDLPDSSPSSVAGLALVPLITHAVVVIVRLGLFLLAHDSAVLGVGAIAVAPIQLAFI